MTSLEYCSLHYLNMWLKHDRIYHDLINRHSREERLRAIKQAAAYYKVARNFPEEYEKGCRRYEPILKIVDKQVASNFAADTVTSISKVQQKISRVYGDRNVLSATTKLLWLKMQTPIIIYDSQARNALGTRDGDFPSFYKAWRKEYSVHSRDIATVCSKLSMVFKYAYDQEMATPSYISEVSAKPWFQERVFDVYLWHKGL